MEASDSTETKSKELPPTREQRINTEERFKKRKNWVSEKRALLNSGETTEDQFDILLAEEIQKRQDTIDTDAALIESLRDFIYTDKLVEAESEEALQGFLDELVNKGECFGLILGDIDHFRDVNTEMGHQGGDNAIVKVAERMSRALRGNEETDEKREGDRFFRRHGDEFAIVIRKLSPNMEGKMELRSIMERVRTGVESEPFELTVEAKTTARSLTVSLGGAVTADASAIDPDRFIHLVDTQALYPAKDLGRNNSFVLNLDQPQLQAA